MKWPKTGFRFDLTFSYFQNEPHTANEQNQINQPQLRNWIMLEAYLLSST